LVKIHWETLENKLSRGCVGAGVAYVKLRLTQPQVELESWAELGKNKKRKIPKIPKFAPLVGRTSLRPKIPASSQGQRTHTTRTNFDFWVQRGPSIWYTLYDKELGQCFKLSLKCHKDNSRYKGGCTIVQEQTLCPTIANFEEKLLEKDWKPRIQSKLFYSSEFTPLSMRTSAKI
jgi:hypothetical protein